MFIKCVNIELYRWTKNGTMTFLLLFIPCLLCIWVKSLKSYL